MKYLLLLCLLYVANATTCTQLRTIYNEANCCSSTADVPCLREIPDCSSVNNGFVCFDGTNIVVKGLLDAFDFTNTNHITLKKSIIPDGNAQYDLGNAENKIRYLYLSN
jgi:hypothetical protein